MAALTVQQISLGTPLTPSYGAAASGGDTFVNDGKTYVHFKNGNVSTPRTVTVNSLVNCDQGFDHNITITVGASSEAICGPFPTSRFNSSANTVGMTYSSEADLTVAAVRFA